MEFDPSTYVVAGISLIALVFGLTEFIKDAANLHGKAVTILAASLGAVLMALYQLQAVLPAPFAQVFGIVVLSLTFGLSASGYYKFVDKRLPPGQG